MGCSRKYPYCKEHSQPLHKCNDCMNKYFPGILVSSNIRKRLVWKCKHSIYLDKCFECKQKTYEQVTKLAVEQFAEMCEPQAITKRSLDFQSPVPSHVLEAVTTLPPLEVDVLSVEIVKRPRVARGTVHRRTLPEPLTMAELERKRASLIATFKRQHATAYTFGVYKLAQMSIDGQHHMYQLYVEVDYKHSVWNDSLLKLDLHGVDSYLMHVPETRKQAVLALRNAVSQGTYKSKIVTPEQKKRIDEESKKQPFIKSLVDLISRWWLLVKYAVPFIRNWKRRIRTLTTSGYIAAERQAFFFKLQHVFSIELPNLCMPVFNPITPEMQRYPIVETSEAAFLEIDVESESLSFLDIDVEDFGQSSQAETLVDKAPWCTFLPSYSACGLKPAVQVRIPGRHVVVTSQTTMTIESENMTGITVGMLFFRLTRTYRITTIESKTITFEKIKDGTCIEPLYLGRLSSKYPNLNSGSILFKKPAVENGSITLAKFSDLNTSAECGQVAKFLAKIA